MHVTEVREHSGVHSVVARSRGYEPPFFFFCQRNAGEEGVRAFPRRNSTFVGVPIEINTENRATMILLVVSLRFFQYKLDNDREPAGVVSAQPFTLVA